MTDEDALTWQEFQLCTKPDGATYLPVSREQHKCHQSTTGDPSHMKNLKENLERTGCLTWISSMKTLKD